MEFIEVKTNQELLDRSRWYRIPERETVRSILDKKFDRDYHPILAKRIIVRCGYWWQPKDMPLEETNQIALSRLAAHIGVETTQVLKLLKAMEAPWVMERTGRMYLEPEYSPSEYIYALKQVYMDIRSDWLKAKNRELGERPRRAFWYVDPPKGDNFGSAYITGRVIKQCGMYYSGRQSGEYGEDWDPPSISISVAQPLLTIRAFDLHPFRFMSAWDDFFYVHPLDIIEE